MNNNILPFSYQYANIDIVGKDLLLDIIDSSNKDLNFILDIVNKKKYKPTYGIKIDKNNNYEYEIYCYNYNPYDRNYEENTILISDIFNNIPITNHLMFSIDINNLNYNAINFYYASKITEKIDIGYSIKSNKIQNKYYRYNPHYYIHPNHIKLFNKSLINFNINNMKHIFIGDKLYRNYIGVYYDGINYNQLQIICNKFNINNNLKKILNKYHNKNFSISIDYNKKTNNIERIGIYGILY